MGEPSNQHPDPLEAELAAFRPQPMSPELHSRIEERLTEPRPYWRIGAALLTFAAAACVVIALGLHWSRDARPGTNYVNSGGTRPSTPFHGNALRAGSQPRLMDYQQAFAESSDAFDALLARPAGSGSAPIRAFSFPSSDLININNTGDQK